MPQAKLPKRLQVTLGVDMEGDACVYIGVPKLGGGHKRYLTRAELEVVKDRYLDPLVTIAIPRAE